MAKKQLIRLTESDLHTVIQEAVAEVLKEVELTNPETGKKMSLHGYYDDDTDKGGFYSGGQPVPRSASDYYTLAALRNKQARQTPGGKLWNAKQQRAFKAGNDAAMGNRRGDDWGRMSQARHNGQNRANDYMQK